METFQGESQGAATYWKNAHEETGSQTNLPRGPFQVPGAEGIVSRGPNPFNPFADYRVNRYSCRMATMGSVRVARTAGTSEAITAVTASSREIAAKVTGSSGLTP